MLDGWTGSTRQEYHKLIMTIKIFFIHLVSGALTLSITSSAFPQKGGNRNKEWFDKLDADKDGRVSKKEYIEAWNIRFSNQDKNKNKHLDFTEWSKHDRSPSRSVSGRVFARKIFNRWDTDGDGQVSQKEYEVFRGAMFTASDADEDGYWTRTEDQQKAAKTTEQSGKSAP